MLNASRIERAFRQHDMGRVVREIASADRDMPLSLRMWLAWSRAAGLAVGLRRLLELTHGPTRTSREMTAALLRMQQPDGGFVSEGRPDPLATACFLAAIDQVTRDQLRTVDRHLLRAHAQAASALRGMQGEAAPGFTLGSVLEQDDPYLLSAYVAYLLADDRLALQSLRFEELAAWLNAHEAAMRPAAKGYWRMARATTHAEPPARGQQLRFAFTV